MKITLSWDQTNQLINGRVVFLNVSMRFQYVAVYSGALAVQCQLSPRTLEKTVRLPGVFAAVVVGPFSDILSVKSIKFMELLVTIGLSAIA